MVYACVQQNLRCFLAKGLRNIIVLNVITCVYVLLIL